MPTTASYHDPNYAAALDELVKTPIVKLPDLLAFTASVFDRPQSEVFSDLLVWSAA